MPDAPPDTPPAPRPSGTLSFQEVAVEGHPELGTGVQARVGVSLPDPPALAEVSSATFGTGCFAWHFTAAAPGNPLLNAGTVTFTAADGTPAMPPCTFVGGRYVCIGGTGTGAAAITPGPGGSWVYSNTGGSFAAADLGRYLHFTNGTGGNASQPPGFPIVAVVDATTVAIGNPGGAAETIASSDYTVFAGVGPAPVPPPGNPAVLDATDRITVVLDATGADPASQVPSFTSSALAPVDDFQLDAASANTITHIPMDGSSITLGCDAASCPAGTGIWGMVLLIETTDAAVPGPPAPDFIFPNPTTTWARVQCAFLSSERPTGAIDVSAAMMAHIQSSGATRIRTTFMRIGLEPHDHARVIIGHAKVGFTTPPPAKK